MAIHIRRREFVFTLGGAAAWPLAVHAQQPAMPVIGLLSSRSPAEAASSVAALRAGLAKAGYVEGQNVTIEYRWALGQYDRLRTRRNHFSSAALSITDDLLHRNILLLRANCGPAKLIR
jgi:putative ABC transport system substrate-binding protein